MTEEITQIEEEPKKEVHLQELVPIKVEEIPLFIRKEWKKLLKEDDEIIIDPSIVNLSKVYNKTKYPFCINLISEENFVIIYKLNLSSKLTNGVDLQQTMAFHLSRKTWKKDILKTNE